MSRRLAHERSEFENLDKCEELKVNAAINRVAIVRAHLNHALLFATTAQAKYLALRLLFFAKFAIPYCGCESNLCIYLNHFFRIFQFFRCAKLLNPKLRVYVHYVDS